MPTLEELIQSSDHSEPEVEESLPEQAQVEPLDGVTFTSDVMDRFPASIYDTTPDSYLYKFIDAMCGDAGAGILKKQTWTSRLKNEGEYLTFNQLDKFYTGHFRFRRLKNELYTLDPLEEVVTADQLEEIERKDAHFKRRVHHFLGATELGNSPAGMEEMAFAGSGNDVEVWENYRYVFDQYSDSPMGLSSQGFSNSVNEFVLLPRLKDADGVIDTDVAYYSNIFQVVTPVPPVFASTAVTPPTFSSLLTANQSWLTGTNVGTNMIPDTQRNMLDLLDRLRPVGALMSVRTMQFRYTEIDVDEEPFPTSERISMHRYVRGRGDVDWPAPDPSNGFWIESNIEKVAPVMSGTAREFPVVFHTIDDIHAYTHQALEDDAYDSTEWYAGDASGFIPFLQYRSEKIGRFLPQFTRIFTFLRNVNPEQDFFAAYALAQPNTILLLEGRDR